MAKVVKTNIEGHWMLNCPGCECTHVIDKRWTFDGNVDQPTFAPSLLIRIGPFPPHSSRPGHIDVCHSFIRNGMMEFLNDCTHKLAGKTVEIPAWSEIQMHMFGTEGAKE